MTVSARDDATEMLLKSLQQTKRFLKILFGFTLLVLGVVMIVTPGPGWLVIALALGVLAAEFVWARQLLDHMKEQGDRLKDQGLRLRNNILSRLSADRA
jgi:tellurite resistance protein TerC/cation:H+ antiporter